MKQLFFILFAIIFGLGIVCGAVAQQPAATSSEAPVVFKSESRIVPVEVVVTDKHGNYVRDLSAKDFQILDDDKEQPVTSFVSPSKSATPEERTYLVLYFDNLSMTMDDQRRLRAAATQFVQAKTGVNALIAAVDFDGAPTITQNFTDDPNLLARAVGGLKQTGVPQKVPGFGDSVDNMTLDYGARSLMLSVQNLAQNLAAVPGRKAVILFSKGFPFTNNRKLDLDLLVKTCARTNVAIYTVDPSGVNVPGVGGGGGIADVSGPTRRGLGLDARGPSNAPSAAANAQTNATNQQILNAIAQETGGNAILNTNDFLAAMQRVSGDQVASYTLGFVPSPVTDGSCHAIRVRVARSGDVVRGRKMYCNNNPAEALAGNPAEKQLESLMSSSAAGTFAASMEAPFFYRGKDTASVNLVLALSPRGLKFERDKGKLHSQLNILGIAYRSDGSVGGRFSDSVNFDLRDDGVALDSFVAQSIHYEKQFQIPTGAYRLKVVFTSDGVNFGKVESPLVIAPYDGKQLALSAIALSHQMRPLSQLDLGVQQALSDDRSPLVANGMEVIPSATSRFSKSQPMAFYAEIYDPALGMPNPPKLGLVLQIVDVKSGKPVKDSGLIDVANMIHPGSAIVPVGINLPIGSLDPGQYRLELQAGNSTGKVSRIREADFVIE